MLIRAPRMLHETGSVGPGWVTVDGATISSVGTGDPPDAASPAELTVPVLSPGFVDLHCHGGDGASFTDGLEPARRVISAHALAGTTTIVASLVTAPVPELTRQVLALAELVTDGELAGVHLEGPWLNPRFAGAHDVRHLDTPDRRGLERLLRVGDRAVKMITLAPELPGALEAIGVLRDAEVLAAVGHTDTDADGVRRAFDAGATMVTHLFNAMRPIHHRAPGPVPVALGDERITVELIADGVHVHPDVLAMAWRSARGPVVLVTDAMAAALAQDGDYRLGTLAVHVADGVARVAGSGQIAGSTLTMHQAVQRAVRSGIPLGQALTAATRTPADTLGRIDLGRLAPGCRADLVAMDDDMRLLAVMRRGEWIRGEGV